MATEPFSNASAIAKLYRLLLGRDLDAHGSAYWTEQLASGVPISAIADSIAATQEAQGRTIEGLPSDDAGWWSHLAQLQGEPQAPSVASINEHRVAPTPFLEGVGVASLSRESLLRDARGRQPMPLWAHGYRAFSQADEDGILAAILHRLDRPKGRFLEIGASDGMENNTTHLLLQGWSGVWIEADPALVERARVRFRPFIGAGTLKVIHAFAALDTIGDVLEQANMGRTIEVLSVDIDGNDHAITGACLEHLSADVAIVEYNPKFGPVVDWVMPYDPRHVWRQDDWYGASLSAFARLMGRHSLSLVGCNMLGSNAFFVRDALLQGSFDGPFTPETWYEPARYHLLPAFHAGHPINRDLERVFHPPAR
ncbi:MAG: DUF4214 domain-containing protein [Beijerinckiaceae bacterium]